MRVGIIGCGQISQVHLSSVLGILGVEVAALCDTDMVQARRTACDFGVARVYCETAEMLAEEQIDAVHILTPPATHAALAIQAMHGGCHVLVEKPLALSLADADRMISVAKQTGKVLCVDHSRMFDPLVLEAKTIMAEGAFGTLVGMEYFQGFPAPPVELHPREQMTSPWLADLGVIRDLAPHAMAFLLEFLGEPEEFHAITQFGVAARGDSQAQEIRVLAAGSDAMGTFTISLRTQPFMCWLSLYGSGMTVEIDFNNRTLITRRERNLPKVLKRGLPCVEEGAQLWFGAASNAAKLLLRRFPRYPGIDELIRRFYASLRNGTEPPVSVACAREVVALVERMAEQSRKEMPCAS